MSDYKINDAGDPRKYYTQLPNIVDDSDLSVYAFRLYVHLKRVAGDSGTCYQSTSTLAKACNMSMGSISNAKKELDEKGFVHISDKEGERGEFSHHEITIIDIWSANMTAYSPGEQAYSPGEADRSPGERAYSPGETKNNPIKNNPIKNNNNKGAKAPASKRKRDARLDEPSIKAYREIVHLHIPIAWRDDVIRVVGDRSEDWKLLVKDWVGRGYNKQNISGMLDAFTKGGIASKSNGGKPAPKPKTTVELMLEELEDGE